MPPPDSPTGTITLHGPHNKIGLGMIIYKYCLFLIKGFCLCNNFIINEKFNFFIALSKVCEKANSVKTATVDAPTWIHKYIIGKNGSNIKKITQEFSKVKSLFQGGQFFFNLLIMR